MFKVLVPIFFVLFAGCQSLFGVTDKEVLTRCHFIFFQADSDSWSCIDKEGEKRTLSSAEREHLKLPHQSDAVTTIAEDNAIFEKVTDKTGGLLKEEIEWVIRRRLEPIKTCYEIQVKLDKNLAGRIKVGFTIDPTGNVSSAEVLQNTLSKREVGQCVTTVIKEWKFPAPRNDAKVIVKYPFVFSSKR